MLPAVRSTTAALHITYLRVGGWADSHGYGWPGRCLFFQSSFFRQARVEFSKCSTPIELHPLSVPLKFLFHTDIVFHYMLSTVARIT